jgi:hypothetical protein
VEKTHDLVRMHFETRFRFTDPREVSLDALNERIEVWTAGYCATRVHTRHGRTRFGAWMAILPEQLRVPASLEALRDAAVREPETRRVDNNKCVSFDAKTYDLSQVPGVVAGLKVTLQVNVFRAPAIDVRFVCPDTGAESWHVVEPAATTEWGFRTDGPVWGQDMRTAAYSEVDQHRNDLLKRAYKVGDGLPSLEEAQRARKAHAQAYAGIVDPMADVKATPVPAYLPRRSTELVMQQRQVEARRLNTVDAAKRLRDMLGAAYTPQVYTHLATHFADGVPEDQLENIAAVFRSASNCDQILMPARPERRAANQPTGLPVDEPQRRLAAQGQEGEEDIEGRSRREWLAARRAERQAALDVKEATIRRNFERLIQEAPTQDEKASLAHRLAAEIERNRALIDDVGYWWRTGT